MNFTRTALIPEARRKHLSGYDAKASHYEIASIHGLASK